MRCQPKAPFHSNGSTLAPRTGTIELAFVVPLWASGASFLLAVVDEGAGPCGCRSVQLGCDDGESNGMDSRWRARGQAIVPNELQGNVWVESIVVLEDDV